MRRGLVVLSLLCMGMVGGAVGVDRLQLEDSSGWYEEETSPSEASSVDEQDTPVMLNDSKLEAPAFSGEYWSPPNYSGQEGSLGYTPTSFAVPKGMEERVAFWVDIYTKYNTDQGLLHDSRYVHVVYEPVDFSDIMKDDSLTLAQKQKARYKRVKEGKENIKERLLKLAKVSSAEGLEGEDLRYWKMFETIEEKNKFTEAIHRNRLRFQLGQSDRFKQGIVYSGRYLSQMEKIFREEGMPVELTRLPFVESSFNLNARSKVGASGIWQFMRSTARRLMRMDASVDERNDPIRATQAAARFLKGNYNMLGSWPLAVTAYNHGPAGIVRMVRKFETDNIAALVDERRGRFGFASANFYASFLAAVEVEREAKKYFGPILREKPLVAKEIRLDKNISSGTLKNWFGGNVEVAQLFNPHVRPNIWKGNRAIYRQNFIRVPEAVYEQAMVELSQMKSSQTMIASSTEGQTYEVVTGDTLSGIAMQFGVSTSQLIEVNDISDPRDLRAGQKLVIPVKP